MSFLHRLSLTLCLVLIAYPVSAYSKDAPNEIKILAYNVWGIYNASYREERMAEIAKAIMELDPDIVVLVEAFEEIHRQIIIDSLKYHGSPLTESRYFPNAAYGSGIFVLSSHPIVKDELIPFRVYVPPGSGEEKMGKSMAVLRVRTPRGDILVVGLHALSRTMFPRLGGIDIQTDARKCSRLLQMYEVARTLHEKRREENVTAVVAAGDFNVYPGLLEYELLMAISGFTNAYDEINPGKDEPTFDSRNTFSTIPIGWMDQRIDHVIYANFPEGYGPALRARDAGVVIKQTFKGPEGKLINLSDHYGVSATLILDGASFLKLSLLSKKAGVSADEKDQLLDELDKSGPDLENNPDLWGRFALEVLERNDREIVYKSRAVKAAAKIIVQIHRPAGFRINFFDRMALRNFLEKEMN